MSGYIYIYIYIYTHIYIDRERERKKSGGKEHLHLFLVNGTTVPPTFNAIKNNNHFQFRKQEKIAQRSDDHRGMAFAQSYLTSKNRVQNTHMRKKSLENQTVIFC